MAVDRPQAPELLKAVARYLREQLMPTLDGFHAFQTRVAANMLDMAAREMAIFPLEREAERQSLESLTGESGDLDTLNRALCRRIRAGELTLDDKALMEHLWR